MNQLRSLFKQTAIYGISTIALRMASWILTPYYSRTLDPLDIGVNAVLMSIVAFVNIVYMFGMETSYFRFVKDHDEESVFKATETAVFINSLILSICLCLFASPIINFLDYPGKEIYIYILSAVLFFENICNIPNARLRYQEKPWKFVQVKALNIGLNIAITFFLLSIVRKGKYTLPFEISSDPNVLIFSAILIPWIFTFIYFSRDILRNISFKNISLQKEILKYSYPLIIFGLAGMVNEVFDRIMLKAMLPYSSAVNHEHIAMYNVNFKLSIIMTLAVQGFRMGAEPFFFKESTNKNAPKTYAVVMDFFIIVCCMMMATTSILREIIAKANDTKYIEGINILPILLLANLLLGVYYNTTIWFKLTNNTKKGATITMIGAVISIATNYLLIPIIGYVGSAIAHLACYLVMTSISLYWGQRIYPIPYHFKYNIAWILGSLAYASLVFYLFQSSILMLIFASIIYLLISGYFAYQRLVYIKQSIA
jgi:O-antigen/teichoic acid export membrane protein